MHIKLGGRQYGKSYQILCEQISELELKIMLAKRIGISYKKEERELKELYRVLDGGNYHVQEKQNKSNKQTTSKKEKNTSWRLF